MMSMVFHSAETLRHKENFPGILLNGTCTEMKIKNSLAKNRIGLCASRELRLFADFFVHLFRIRNVSQTKSHFECFCASI